MKKIILIIVVLLLAVAITVFVTHRSSPSGQVPDLDAAAIDTGKNLHPPKLNP